MTIYPLKTVLCALTCRIYNFSNSLDYTSACSNNNYNATEPNSYDKYSSTVYRPTFAVVSCKICRARASK